MANVKVTDTIDAPAKSVWGLLRDFGGIAKFAGGAIQGCTVEGEGIGAVRTLSVAGGARIRERLEGLDEAACTLSYSIIGQSPLPVRDYLSTVRVREEGADRAVIDWSSTFEPVGVTDEQAAGIIRGVYTGAIAGIKKTLGG